MSILQRYVLRELLGPLAMGLTVFTFVVLIARVFKLADILLNSSAPLSLAGELLLLLLPGILSFTIPMAVLVAILLSVGRLAADREILAIRTTGVNLLRIFIPVIVFAGFLTATMMIANQRLIPYLQQKSADLGMQLQFHVLSAMPAGIAYELPSEDKGGDTTFFYDRKNTDGSGAMQDVMMYLEMPDTADSANLPTTATASDKRKAGKKAAAAQLAKASAKTAPTTSPKGRKLTKQEREQLKIRLKVETPVNEVLVVAKSAQIVPDISNRVLNFELTSGSIHFSNPDSPGAYDVVKFDTMAKGYVPTFAQTEDGQYIKKTTEMSNRELLVARSQSGKTRGARFMVEFWQRYSIPLACVAFALIAIPLAVYVRPTGKAIAFALSFLLILLYYGLLQYGVALGKTGNTIGTFAIFFPNVLLISVGAVMMYRMASK